MNYAEAAKLRKTGLGELITNRIIEGKNASITRAVSDKFAARATGFKETFGLMNLAKVLTGGSNLAAAFMGRMTGAKPEDIRHVTGRRQAYSKSLGEGYGMNRGSSTMSNEVLEKMLNFMQQTQAKETQNLDMMMTYEEFQSKLREDNHREIMEVLLKATLNKRKAEKQMKAEAKKRAQIERDKKAMGQPPAPTVPTPKTPAPAPKPAPSAPAPVPKPTPSAPAPAPAPTAPSIPTTAAKTATRAITKEAAKTAAKIGVTAIGVYASSSAFAKDMFPYAKVASQKLGGKIPPEAILAQWAGESGGGSALPAPFNYAGIKAGPNDKKAGYVLTEERYTPEQLKKAQQSGETLERVLGPKDKITKAGRQVTVDEWFGKGSMAKAMAEGKKWVQIKTYFSKYDSPEEFVENYVKVLSKDRYKKVREATDAKTFGLEVAKAGYATAAPQKYSEKISSFVKQNADMIGVLSTENADMKKEMNSGSGSTVMIIENTNNSAQKTVNTTSMPYNNVNPRLRR